MAQDFRAYEIEFRYNDEPKNTLHNCIVGVYNRGSRIDEILQGYAEEYGIEELDETLAEYNLQDNDICFYVEKTNDLRKELEESFDIEVKEIYE